MQNTTMKVENLSTQESKLIEHIRSGKYNSILVKFKEGQPNSVELSQTHTTDRRVIDILRDDPFQTITIKTQRGRIAYIESIQKQKLA